LLYRMFIKCIAKDKILYLSKCTQHFALHLPPKNLTTHYAYRYSNLIGMCTFIKENRTWCLRFSQWWVFRFWSLGLWYCVSCRWML
jgi:hypothetical protein